MFPAQPARSLSGARNQALALVIAQRSALT